MAVPTIEYNGYTIPNPFGKFLVVQDEEEFTFSTNFLIKSDTSANLVSACDTAEDKLSEKWKDFSMSFDGTTEYNFSHSSSTGFLAQPQLTQLDGALNTYLTRPYRFFVSIKLPFDQSGFSYRRNGSYTVRFAKNRGRTVVFSAEYTAGGGNTARDNYDSNIDTWTGAVLTALSGTYEKIAEDIVEDMEEKLVNAQVAYQEILAYQKSGSLDEAKLVDPVCNYIVEYDQEIGLSPTGGYSMQPIVRILLAYSTAISKDEVASENDIEDVYQDTVKPWLLSHARAILGTADYPQAGSTYIVQSERKTVDPYNYTVSGQMVLLAPKTLDQVLGLSEVVRYEESEGKQFSKLWDGRDHSYGRYSIGKEHFAYRSITIAKLGSPAANPPKFPDPDEGKWEKFMTKRTIQETKTGAGTNSGAKLTSRKVYHTTWLEAYRYVVSVAESAVRTL
jgi:hypothetical protein